MACLGFSIARIACWRMWLGGILGYAWKEIIIIIVHYFHCGWDSYLLRSSQSRDQTKHFTTHAPQCHLRLRISCFRGAECKWFLTESSIVCNLPPKVEGIVNDLCSVFYRNHLHWKQLTISALHSDEEYQLFLQSLSFFCHYSLFDLC